MLVFRKSQADKGKRKIEPHRSGKYCYKDLLMNRSQLLFFNFVVLNNNNEAQLNNQVAVYAKMHQMETMESNTLITHIHLF